MNDMLNQFVMHTCLAKCYDEDTKEKLPNGTICTPAVCPGKGVRVFLMGHVWIVTWEQASIASASGLSNKTIWQQIAGIWKGKWQTWKKIHLLLFRIRQVSEKLWKWKKRENRFSGIRRKNVNFGYVEFKEPVRHLDGSVLQAMKCTSRNSERTCLEMWVLAQSHTKLWKLKTV